MRRLPLVATLALALLASGCTTSAGSVKDVASRHSLGPGGSVNAVSQVVFSSKIGGNLAVFVNATGGPVNVGIQSKDKCGAFLDGKPPSYFPDSRYGGTTIRFDYYVKPGDYCLALENQNGNSIEVDVLVKLPR